MMMIKMGGIPISPYKLEKINSGREREKCNIKSCEFYGNVTETDIYLGHFELSMNNKNNIMI